MNCFFKKIFVSVCLMSLVGVCFAVSEDEVAKITSAAPDKAAVEPKQQRKILVFNFCQGFKHSSIPYCSKAIEVLGSKTGAFTCDVRADKSAFTAGNLKQYDAIIFNSTTKLTFDDQQRKAIMDFVKGGKGIVGIHGATDNFYKWPEAAEMMGGTFDGHPWVAKGTWAIKIEDCKNPVAAAFNCKDFKLSDEIYRTKQINLRKNARVLIGLDMTDETNLNAKGVRKDDVDIPISWIRDFGKGRVFYCGLGHNHEIFWNRAILKHYLDGIQFAMGDLKADTTPVAFGAAMGDTEIDELLATISGYQYGLSRQPLTDVEDVVNAAGGDSSKLSVIEKSMLRFLEGDSTLTSKQFVCRQLSLIGTDRSVAVLGKMLRDSNTADMARYALERIPGQAVDAVLLEAMAKTGGKLKIGIINSIGNRKTAGAVDEIGRLIILSSDRLVVDASISAVGKIATGQSVKVLLSAYEIEGDALKPALQYALLNCADSLQAEGNEKEAIAIYDKVYADAANDAIRVSVFRSKVLSCSDEAAEAIIEAIKSGDKALSSQAIYLIDSVKKAGDLKSIFDAADELDSAGKVQLILTAGEIGLQAAGPLVLQSVKSGDQEIRIAALKALKSVGTSQDAILLAGYAARSTGTEQSAARKSLYGSKASGFDKVIVGNLNRSEPKIAAELVMAVSQRKIGNTASDLIRLAPSDDRALSRESFKALAVVAEDKDYEAVVDLLVNLKNQRSRPEAEKTIFALTGDSSKKADTLLSVLNSTEDAKTKASLLMILGKTGSPKALFVLRMALAGSNDDVKSSAIRAMSNWPEGSAASDLLNVAERSQNKIHQVLALRGFISSISLMEDKSSSERVALYKKAMDIASSSTDKRGILSGLSNEKTQKSFDVVVSYLNDASLKREAAVALASICSEIKITDNNRELIKETLEQISKDTNSKSVKKDVVKQLKRLR